MAENHKPRIAYLTGEYPAVSHTFILREITALRDLGLSVETCSVRRTGSEHHRGEAEKHAARTTFYVLAHAKNPLSLIGAQLSALRRPKRYFATLLKAWHLRPAGFVGALYQLFYFAEATILARHLVRKKIDRLHNHFAGPSASVAILAAKLAGIPFSFTLHGPADLQETQRWRLSEKIEAADFLSCISYFARSQAMLNSHPAHWAKLKVVHCGVSPQKYDLPAASPDGGPHLLFVGRLAAAKGLPVLMEAFAAALSQRPDLRLTLVGDGVDRAALQEMAAPLGDAVRFLGYRSQDEVASILAGSDIFVLPSFAEGVPVVLMEAMASGKPVVATRIAGISELVEDGVSGFLIPPGDPDALTQRILQLCDDPALRHKMGSEGRRMVQAEFDIRSEAARLASLFRGKAGSGIRPAADTDSDRGQPPMNSDCNRSKNSSNL